MTDEETKPETNQEEIIQDTSDQQDVSDNQETKSGEPTEQEVSDSEDKSDESKEESTEVSEEEEEPVEMVEIPKDRLEELENAEAIFKDQLMRERAESINYRKRLQKQRDEFAEVASVRVLSKVLTVKDDLKRLLDNANGEIPETHLEGIQLMQQRLEGIFNAEGVELIKIEEGKTPYDPKFMEAVVSQPIPDVKPNTVMGVINQGFKKGDRVLRAAKVMISKAPPEEKPAETKAAEEDKQSEEISQQTQESSTSDAPDNKSENGDKN